MSGRVFFFAAPLMAMLALAGFPSASAQSLQDFPEDPAKKFVQQICMQCHMPAFLLGQRRTEADWKKTVTRMSQKGLGGPVENYEAVGAYMFKNFGKTEDTTKVNMNKAASDEIVQKIGLTKDEAAAIVGYRERHGDFHEWDDMLVIYGVDGRKLEAAKDKMTF